MGEALRHVKRVTAVGIELDAEPCRMRRRAGPEIDDHVVDRAPCAANELRLPMRLPLEMHTAERAALRIARDAALRKLGLEPMLGELVAAPRAGEEAALVLVPLELDDVRAPELGRDELHARNTT